MSAQPVLYRDMLHVATSELANAGIGYDKAISIAQSITTRFCEAHGEKIYRVPTLQGMKKAERDTLIRQQSATMTVAKIAKAHGLAQWTVREIISGE